MKLLIQVLLIVLLPSLSFYSWSSGTYITAAKVEVYADLGQQQVATWQDRTLFTAKQVVQQSEWLEVTGTFPEALWQPTKTPIYIKLTDKIKVRVPYQEKAAKTVLYQSFESTGNKAKAYKLLQETQVYLTQPIVDETEKRVLPPEQFVTWTKDKVFTARYQNRYYLKATGHFPEEGKWQALPQPLWILKPVKLQDRTRPRQFKREAGAKRFAVINKSKFELTMYEVLNGEQKKLLRTPVALGYDRCLSAEKGGKCYYTPEGQFDVEFKLFDPDGINWCIPPKMNQEFAAKLASGERCFRGVMGNHALHFGNSLFLHGTSNPDSIGSRTTHGCVRLRNPDISMVYRLLEEGDKVLISETPEQFDLIEMSQQANLVKDVHRL